MSNTCFVLMPFSDPFNSYYKNILAPAIRKAGFEPITAGEIYGTGPIIEDIFQGIRSSAAVVADVTGKNPNVNYELGIGHTLNRPVVIISQSIDDVPFDYRHLRVIIYDTKEVRWESKLKASLINTLENTKKLDRPASSVVTLSEWDFNPFWSRVDTATEICQQAVSSFGFINESAKYLTEFIIRGGVLRVILVDPIGQAMKMASARVTGAANNPEYAAKLNFLAEEKLRELARHSSRPNSVRLRFVNHLIDPVLTLLDPQSDNGIMYVTLNGYGKSITTRPSFNLHKGKDDHWFSFFYESFENSWNATEVKEVALL
jgi:hypothetical protein